MNAQISAAITIHMINGKNVREAVDAVLGAGTYEKMAGDLYDALRVKGGK